MKVSGIICEYNPLHKGHVYQIEETRRHGADAIVCVMSGNYVQRAEFAMMRKHARAESAILAGADLVFELPTPWAIASAEGFAKGSVGILNALGVITHLSFGCECAEISSLETIARYLLTDEFREEICKELKLGISFAAAREQVVHSKHPEFSHILKTPNNILAIEYIKALFASHSSIEPESVLRTGCMHDNPDVTGTFASASAIRALLKKGDIARAYSFMPEESITVLEREYATGFAPVFQEDASKTMLSHLKRMHEEDFLMIPDVTEGLEVRLCKAVRNATTLEEAIMLAKTKRYAHSRIRRIFLAAFLNISREVSYNCPPYARVLAFNDTGRAILKSCKKNASISIITKPADSKKLESYKFFSNEALNTELFSLFMPQPQSGMQDFRSTPIYIKGKHDAK